MQKTTLFLFGFCWLGLCSAWAGAAYRPSDYKGYSTAVGFWDGIDNTGTGVHDSSATTWTSLVSNLPLELVTDNAEFSANALVCKSRTAGIAALGSVQNTTTMKTYQSIEFVFDSTEKNTSVLWSSGSGYGIGRHFFLSNKGAAYLKTYPAAPYGKNAWEAGPCNVSGTYDQLLVVGAVYSNGVMCTMGTDKYNPEMYEYRSTGYAFIGGYLKNGNTETTAGYPFVGSVYALRLNANVLTQQEIAWNAHLDEARFSYGGNVHVLGFPEEYNTPSPAYGSTTQSGSTVTFSPGVLTRYDDSAYAAPVSDGIRVKCLGYVRDGDTSVTNAIPSEPLTLVDGMTVAWIWQKQCRIVAKATSDCASVSVNGLSGTCVTNWISEGATVTVTPANVTAGRAVVAWHGSGTGGSTDSPTGVYTISVSAPLTLTPWTAEKTTLRFWRGTSASAATAANWRDWDGNESLPVDGSTVVLDASSGDVNLTWDLNDVTLGNWVQDGYNGTVTFKNGPGGKSGSANNLCYGVLASDGVNRYVELAGDVLVSSGVWTHPKQPTFSEGDAGMTSGTGVWRIGVHAQGDFEIGSGATLNADGCGFYNYQGPGTRANTLVGGSNGGRGGFEGDKRRDEARPCYGDPRAPVSVGSASSGDRRGGGAIEIKAGGCLRLSGTISVDGLGKDASTDYYAGAGGSVWLTAGTLSGDGVISARGGAAVSGGAGGGGRIAYIQTGAATDFSAFTPTLEAGCRTFDGKPAVGTIYREKASDNGAGELDVIGYGVMPLRLVSTDLVDVGRDYTFSKVTLTNGARLGLSTGAVVRIEKLVTDSQAMSGIALWGGTLVLPDNPITNLELSVYRPGSKILFGSDAEERELRIGEGCTLYCDAPFTVPALRVLSGGLVTHAKNAADGYLNDNTSRYVRVQLTVTGNATVDAGGSIDVSGRGYQQLKGPGADNSTGGSHGGLARNGNAGKCYGSITQPISFGSGAKSFSGSYGGGALRIVCGGTLTVNGAITADATHATGSIDTSPSGGSVWIETADLAGSGTITADGGLCSTLGLPGGGGRIAVALTRNGATFDDFRAAGGLITARGGYVSGNYKARYAGAGTLYLSTVTDNVTNGTLVVDNDGVKLSENCPTVIEPSVTELAVDHVLVTNGGLLKVSQDATLTVSGNFATGGRFVMEDKDGDHAGGTVAFVDTNRISTITGTNTFANLVCVEPGKTLSFGTEADATLTQISSTGRFTVTGEEGLPVYLRSATEGTYWLLNMIAGSTAAIAFADVKDSDAESAGGGSVAPSDSTDSGHNLNWNFVTIHPGDTITWTGAVDGKWSTAKNWNPERLPVDTDVVVIPGGLANFPALAEAATLNSLTVAADGWLDLATFSLTVTNQLTVHGTLVCKGSERIEASGPTVVLDAFTPAESEFVLSGDLAQTFSLASLAFNNLTVSKSGGSLSFSSGFSAKKFSATSTAAYSMAFAAGGTVDVDEFTVHGTDAARITLKSTTEGTRWTADVAKVESVHGVNVQDAGCSGLDIYADAPASDLGNNASGWVFGGRSIRWIGESGASFTNETCWSDGKSPDETSRVIFDADAKAVLDAPVTVRELKAEAGAAVIDPSTNVLTVVVSMLIENGATLSLNVPTVISNAVVVRTGGVLTHEVMAALGLAITNRIDLTVCGDMTVEAGGAVDATGKGFKNSLQCAGFGGSASGTSHGGQGGNVSTRAYDSVFHPKHPGSSSSTMEPNTAAGGVIHLKIDGCLTVNGDLCANGGESTCYTCSGGSILVYAGRLAGSGTVQAKGSRETSYSGYRSSGGRIAFYLKDGDYATPEVSFAAYGSCNRHPETLITSAPSGAAGTIYLAKTDAPYAGHLIIDAGNADLTGQYTQLPVDYGPEIDNVDWYRGVTLTVRNGASIEFTSDLKLAELEYPSGKVSVKLNDHEIFIRSTVHRNADRRNDRGWVTRATENKGTNGTGHYRWLGRGLTILVR